MPTIGDVSVSDVRVKSPMGVIEGLVGINDTGMLMGAGGLSIGSVVKTSVVTIADILLLQSNVVSMVCGSEMMSSSSESCESGDSTGVMGSMGEGWDMMVGTRGVSANFIISTVFNERALSSTACKSYKNIEHSIY